MTITEDVNRHSALLSARAGVIAEILDCLADVIENPSMSNLDRAGLVDDDGGYSHARLLRGVRESSRRLAISAARVAELVELSQASTDVG